MMNKTLKKALAVLLTALLVLTVLPLGAFASTRSSSSTNRADRLDTSPVVPKSKATEVKKEEEKVAPTAKTVNPFISKPENVTALYKAKSGAFTVSPILNTEENHSIFFATLNTLENNDAVKKVEISHDEAAKTNEGSYLVVLKTGQRIIYSLNQNNVIQAGDSYYQVPEAAYKNLKVIYDTDYKQGSYTQWMIMMMPSKVTGITTNDGTGVKPVAEANLKAAVQTLRTIRASQGSQNSPIPTGLAQQAGVIHVQLQFANEEGKPTYDLYFVGDTLHMVASELRFSTQYTLLPGEMVRIITALTGVAPVVNVPQEYYPTEEATTEAATTPEVTPETTTDPTEEAAKKAAGEITAA